MRGAGSRRSALSCGPRGQDGARGPSVETGRLRRAAGQPAPVAGRSAGARGRQPTCTDQQADRARAKRASADQQDQSSQPKGKKATGPRTARLFYFCIFQKKNLQKYIFGFRFYSSIPLPPSRGPTARQVDGKDLYVNKKNLRSGPWREPAAPLPGGRLPPLI